jgi:outer membrane biogenesis lipoprotein LolB
MKLLFSLCACLLLTACLTSEERMQAARERNDAKDDAKCQSSGAKPGEAAYVQCRQQLDAARLDAARTRSDAAMSAIMAGPSSNCVRGSNNCF